MIKILLTAMMLTLPQVEVSGNAEEMVSSEYDIGAPILVEVKGGISDGMANKFSEEMAKALVSGQPIIIVEIDSYGGSVYALMNMIDVMNKAKEKVAVVTVVLGKAMSAGAVLASCGTEGMRYISPSGTIMIHEVSNVTAGKVGDIEADAEETTRLNTLLMKTISENIGKDSKYISSIIHSRGHSDWYITPDEAMKHGLVNHIGSPDYMVKIKVDLDIK